MGSRRRVVAALGGDVPTAVAEPLPLGWPKDRRAAAEGFIRALAQLPQVRRDNIIENIGKSRPDIAATVAAALGTLGEGSNGDS